jgi:hypothetical protein
MAFHLQAHCSANEFSLHRSIIGKQRFPAPGLSWGARAEQPIFAQSGTVQLYEVGQDDKPWEPEWHGTARW